MACGNQAMLSNLMANQTMLLRTIESQNNNQARMIELITATLRVVELSSRNQQEALASLGATVSGSLGVFNSHVVELEEQTSKLLVAIQDLNSITKSTSDTLQRVAERLG